MSRQVKVLTVLLVAMVTLLGPASPAQAAPPPGGGTVLVAQSADDWGQDVRDRYGISANDYSIDVPHGEVLGIPTNPYHRAVIGAADVQFNGARLIVAMVVQLLRFALDFTLADLLLSPVQQLIDTYQASYVGDLTGGGWGLIPLALMLCVFWFGLAALRGQVGRGMGEIAVSFLLAVVLGALLANPGALLGEGGLYGRAKDLGIDVAITAVQPPPGHQPPQCPLVPPDGGVVYVDGCWHPEDGGRFLEPQPDRTSDPQYLRWVLQQWLVDLYIRQPHQRMTYGQQLDCPLLLAMRGDDENDVPCEPHPCVEQYNDIIRASPDTVPTSGVDVHFSPNPLIPPLRRETNPENYMVDMMKPGGIDGEGGCDEGEALANYLSRANTERLAVGMVLAIAVFALLAFVLVGVVIPIVAGQLMLAVLVLALVFVLPVALLGGGSRQILWKWLGLLLAAIFMIIIALVGLSLMLVVTEVLLRGDTRVANLLLASLSSLLFLLVQRKLLIGAMGGGRGIGMTAGRLLSADRRRPAVPARQQAARPGAWSRAATGGIDLANLGTKVLAAKAGVMTATATKNLANRIPAVAETRHERAVAKYDAKQRVKADWRERNNWQRRSPAGGAQR